MKVHPLPPGRGIVAYGSVGAAYRPVAPLPEGVVGVVELAPEGRLGTHATPTRQVMLVLQGSGWAQGADGAQEPLGVGDVVSFAGGEARAVRAGKEGLTLLVVEGASG